MGVPGQALPALFRPCLVSEDSPSRPCQSDEGGQGLSDAKSLRNNELAVLYISFPNGQVELNRRRHWQKADRDRHAKDRLHWRRPAQRRPASVPVYLFPATTPAAPPQLAAAVRRQPESCLIPFHPFASDSFQSAGWPNCWMSSMYREIRMTRCMPGVRRPNAFPPDSHQLPTGRLTVATARDKINVLESIAGAGPPAQCWRTDDWNVPSYVPSVIHGSPNGEQKRYHQKLSRSG